mmetsp:Transcript_51654/g.122955  ORF Transcript_51654/g.122955 Transcript_51654/m.122955 type:complete len:214 (+) Transcript_51654:234-875(+)
MLPTLGAVVTRTRSMTWPSTPDVQLGLALLSGTVSVPISSSALLMFSSVNPSLLPASMMRLCLLVLSVSPLWVTMRQQRPDISETRKMRSPARYCITSGSDTYASHAYISAKGFVETALKTIVRSARSSGVAYSSAKPALETTASMKFLSAQRDADAYAAAYASEDTAASTIAASLRSSGEANCKHPPAPAPETAAFTISQLLRSSCDANCSA